MDSTKFRFVAFNWPTVLRLLTTQEYKLHFQSSVRMLFVARLPCEFPDGVLHVMPESLILLMGSAKFCSLYLPGPLLSGT